MPRRRAAASFHSHPLLGYVERHSAPSLLVQFVGLYLALGVLVGTGYWLLGRAAGGGLTFPDAVYFSIITQSTVGYGDIQPTTGPQKALAAIHAVLGVVVFAMGAGVALAKLLTPGRDAILIDDTLLFDPDDNRFRMRVVNRLPVPLYSISVDVRLRHKRQVGDRTYFRRRSVKPLVETLSILPPRRPNTVSTATITDGEAPIQLDTPSVGQAVTLFPEHIGAGVSVHVAMTAQYFAGNVVALKDFAADSIACGRFQRTYRSDEPVDWDKWGRVTETDPSRCTACTHRDACGLRARLSAPNGETAPTAPGAGRPDAALTAPSDRGR